MRFGVRSEYDPLRAVVMASPRHFWVAGPINVTQRRYFASEPPRVDALVREQAAFTALLEASGARVFWAEERPESPFQVNTRDVGAVVGGFYIQGRMRRPIRAAEIEAVEPLLAQFEGPRIALPEGYFEGGDVLVDGDDVILGVGERTDRRAARGLAILAEHGFRLHVVELAPEILHLDVVLTLLPERIALIYRAGLREVPRSVLDRYELIEVSAEEQERLATNVFCIDPTTVVGDERNERILGLLAGRGLIVHALPLADTTKIGGAFRCMTLPLVRGE